MSRIDPGGYPCIFKHKAGGSRYQGVLTRKGARAFEQARRRLRKLAGLKRDPTDADVMEFLARGEAETRKVLEQ